LVVLYILRIFGKLCEVILKTLNNGRIPLMSC